MSAKEANSFSLRSSVPSSPDRRATTLKPRMSHERYLKQIVHCVDKRSLVLVVELRADAEEQDFLVFLSPQAKGSCTAIPRDDFNDKQVMAVGKNLPCFHV